MKPRLGHTLTDTQLNTQESKDLSCYQLTPEMAYGLHSLVTLVPVFILN